MAFLSILIPTYNRAEKLRRLLDNIEVEISTSGIEEGQINVIVSDNASTDSTPNILNDFEARNFKLIIFRQKENIGLDGNVLFLYEQAKSQYVWYFSDDDILLHGSINEIFNCLKANRPDVLLFSFMQPPGSKQRTFDFSDEVKVINSASDIINLLTLFPKISIYILKHINLSESDYKEFQKYNGCEYYVVALSFTVLEKSENPNICIISRHLASCDSEYKISRFPPETWIGLWIVFTHPYVKANEPKLVKTKMYNSYYLYIDFYWRVKGGSLKVENMDEYDVAIRNLKIHILWLSKKPKMLVKLILLKFKLVWVSPYLKVIYERFKHFIPIL